MSTPRLDYAQPYPGAPLAASQNMTSPAQGKEKHEEASYTPLTDVLQGAVQGFNKYKNEETERMRQEALSSARSDVRFAHARQSANKLQNELEEKKAQEEKKTQEALKITPPLIEEDKNTSDVPGGGALATRQNEVQTKLSQEAIQAFSLFIVLAICMSELRKMGERAGAMNLERGGLYAQMNNQGLQRSGNRIRESAENSKFGVWAEGIGSLIGEGCDVVGKGFLSDNMFLLFGDKGCGVLCSTGGRFLNTVYTGYSQERAQEGQITSGVLANSLQNAEKRQNDAEDGQYQAEKDRMQKEDSVGHTLAKNFNVGGG